MLPYVHRGIFSETLNTACRWSKISVKNNTLSIAKVGTFEATPKFWGMEYWKQIASKGHANDKQNLICLHWWHGPLFFLHKFLRFVLLLMLHHSVKLAIPHVHMFLILQIMHLFLFKSLQHQDELSISIDIRVVFWWARYGNCRLSFLKRSDLPFVWNGFVAIYFWPIFDRQFRKYILLVLQQCGEDCVVIGGR